MNKTKKDYFEQLLRSKPMQIFLISMCTYHFYKLFHVIIKARQPIVELEYTNKVLRPLIKKNVLFVYKNMK